jgi:hypothetical protein
MPVLKLHWLSRRAFNGRGLDVAYIAAQLSLDLCKWKPTHSRLIALPLGLGTVRWYSGEKMPACRRVEGPRGDPLVSFAIAQDCGHCPKCKPLWPFRVARIFVSKQS